MAGAWIRGRDATLTCAGRGEPCGQEHGSKVRKQLMHLKEAHVLLNGDFRF
jgi:hypothetical protein